MHSLKHPIRVALAVAELICDSTCGFLPGLPLERWNFGFPDAMDLVLTKKTGLRLGCEPKNSGFSPQIIHFNFVFHYKPIHFGVPLFLETPTLRQRTFFKVQVTLGISTSSQKKGGPTKRSGEETIMTKTSRLQPSIGMNSSKTGDADAPASLVMPRCARRAKLASTWRVQRSCCALGSHGNSYQAKDNCRNMCSTRKQSNELQWHFPLKQILYIYIYMCRYLIKNVILLPCAIVDKTMQPPTEQISAWTMSKMWRSSPESICKNSCRCCK